MNYLMRKKSSFDNFVSYWLRKDAFDPNHSFKLALVILHSDDKRSVTNEAQFEMYTGRKKHNSFGKATLREPYDQIYSSPYYDDNLSPP